MQLRIDKIYQKEQALLAIFNTHNWNYVKETPIFDYAYITIEIVQLNPETLLFIYLKVFYIHLT